MLYPDYLPDYLQDGEERRSYSVLEAIQRSDFRSLMNAAPSSGDIFHTNTLVLLPRGDGAPPSPFSEGEVLLSIPHLNALVVVDLNHNRVIWALVGIYAFQHDPVLLENGNILVLDNRGQGRKMSRVVEIDPNTQEIVWGYYGDRDNGFYTATCGTSQRLPNGNTLITESDAGRAFEVSPEGAIVWEYLSPHRAKDAPLVATLFEVHRLALNAHVDWLR